MVVQMAKKNEHKNMNQFINKVISESKPIEPKKIIIKDVDTPPRWKVEKPKETGFIFEDFEVIIDENE